MTIYSKLDCVWFHVPNEAIFNRNRFDTFAYTKKNIGQVSGVADLIFLGANKNLCIELKTGRGYQQANQKLFELWCEVEGIGYIICDSVTSVEAALLSSGFLHT
jgi:hypothetical protein